jgi:probable HAF family extracellular repeat protein
MKRKLIAALLLCLGASAHLSAASPADAIEFSITELPAPPGFFVQPVKITDSGDILAMAYDSQTKSHPVVYRQGLMHHLLPPDLSGYAIDMNNAGDVICHLTPPQGGLDPILIRADGSIVYLFHNFPHPIFPVAINDVGDMVGAGGGGIDIYNYITGASRSVQDPTTGNIFDINNQGEVVAFSVEGSGESGILFQGDTSIHLNLPGKRERTDAVLINNRGLVAGFAYELDPFTGSPFLYQDGHFTRLGTLKGDDIAGAYGLNDEGQVVGASWRESASMRAYLYSGRKMKDLNTLIPQNSGWDLREALSINNNGQIIGDGAFQGRFAGFLLTPHQPIPQPSSVPKK